MNNVMKSRSKIRKVSIWIILILLVIVAAVFSMFCGRYGLDPYSVVEAVLGNAKDDITANIVLSVRLPRVILTFLVGAGLAISGASFQGVFQNPLVSPDVLSVSSGAAFGAVLGIMLNGSNALITAIALSMGLVSVAITYVFARVNGRVSTLSLVLSGMIISALFNALISLMKYACRTDACQ